MFGKRKGFTLQERCCFVYGVSVQAVTGGQCLLKVVEARMCCVAFVVVVRGVGRWSIARRARTHTRYMQTSAVSTHATLGAPCR
eukprot:6852475-Pyramimonas_sp.AAC.1